MPIKSWQKAQEYCENLGAWLAEIHDQDTFNLLSQHGKSLNPNLDWWLGASDQEQVSLIFFYSTFFSHCPQAKSWPRIRIGILGKILSPKDSSPLSPWAPLPLIASMVGFC